MSTESLILKQKNEISHTYGGSFSPDNRLLAFDTNGDGWIYHVSTGFRLQQIPGVHGINYLVFSPDGQQMATTNIDGNIRIYRIDDLMEIRQFRSEARYRDLSRIVYSPDGRLLAYLCRNMVKIFDIDLNRVVQTYEHDSYPSMLEFSPDGTKIAFGSPMGIYIWDITARNWLPNFLFMNAANVTRIGENNGWVTDIAFSPDSQKIALAGRFGIGLWNIATSLLVDRIEESCCRAVTFLPAGTLAYSMNIRNSADDIDFSIRLYDYQQRKELFRLGVYNKRTYIRRLIASPNGCHLASVDQNNEVKLWSIRPNGSLTKSAIKRG